MPAREPGRRRALGAGGAVGCGPRPDLPGAPRRRQPAAAPPRPARAARSPAPARRGPDDRHEGQRRWRDHERATWPPRRHSSGQARAALAPTGGQDGPSGAGRHPVPEPVVLRALSVVRLKGALHVVPPRRSAPGAEGAPAPTRLLDHPCAPAPSEGPSLAPEFGPEGGERPLASGVRPGATVRQSPCRRSRWGVRAGRAARTTPQLWPPFVGGTRPQCRPQVWKVLWTSRECSDLRRRAGGP